MQKTQQQYQQIKAVCLDLFQKKMRDYGLAWRILRTTSLTDQLYIKARRIRTIEMQGAMKVDENPRSEYIGIINYSIMALIQLEKGIAEEDDLSEEATLELYQHYFDTAYRLMENKNHDYGEAWREMRLSSITDLILMKLKRIKQIENHAGKTVASEGIDANYLDMINYAVFALIKIDFPE